MNFLITAVFSYLLGSIPFGYLLVRTFRGEDVRQSGSGNIGATNVSRTSPALGVLTLILDALKGVAAVLLARALFPGEHLLAVLAAMFAILGHVFPVWLRFRGGKGVATGLGSFVVLVPKAILLMVVVFVLMVMTFRYVSLASIISVALTVDSFVTIREKKISPSALPSLDTVQAVAESLYSEFKEQLYTPPSLLLRMVEAGLLGRKAGRGFYEY